ncbi:MAG TPA: proline--tRNA ligase [Syntrophomonadaceae bacterium]|nr:proline--tRNA ligase [Syntrophomonadaceae bacterium]
MKASELFYPTLREVPNEAEVVSHQLLLRAGFIRKTTAGIYTYLPLGYRVIKKIIDIVREEMDRAGGQEILMPIIQPKELWEQSGRWSVYGDEMFRVKDRHDHYFALGPTHEEIITSLVDGDVHSYRDLPLLLYQIQNKYRDEIRPRFGLMRGREFIMKDLYSFDLDETGLDTSYHKMYDAYKKIYGRLNLNFRVVEADSGAIGGNESHEFMVLADTGECLIVYCDNCHYAANVEKAECIAEDKTSSADDEIKPLTKIHTPGQRTIKDLVHFLGTPESQQVKTLLYQADDEIVAAVVRGDRELNEIKLKNVLKCTNLFMADEPSVRAQCGAGFGSLGPVNLNFKVYVDAEVAAMQSFTCGANEDDYHYQNVCMGRDFVPEAIYDLRCAAAGDNCPCCGEKLKTTRGIEVGHIFKLGTKYSDAMHAVYLDQGGKEQPMVMGCYGIGISRTMAAAVEQNFDENGIIWPIPIAPYHVIIVPVNANRPEQMETAMKLYHQLCDLGAEVIVDDRDERAGVKFKDADLTGIPVRITIGPKSLQENKAEVKKRWEKESILVDLDKTADAVIQIIKP